MWEDLRVTFPLAEGEGTPTGFLDPVSVLFSEIGAQILWPNCDLENSRSFTNYKNNLGIYDRTALT